MKKVISSLLVMSLMLYASVAKADNLTVEQAKTIGCYYMASQTGYSKLAPEHLTLIYQFENLELGIPSAYVFNVNSCGWIIIAASSVVDPIIAFSTESTLDMSDIPDNMRWWLNGYTDVIASVQVLDAEKDYPDSQEYTQLVKEGKNGTKDQQVVLMTTTWDQGTTRNPTYNYYCPKVGNRYSVTGCVATALAQICKYYEYPVQPKGTKTYNWNGTTLSITYDTVQFDYSLMPKYLKGNTPQEQKLEVAKLNYCLGVAVEMDYSPDGSGAHMQNASEAMRFRFKYQRNTETYRRGSGTDTSFVNTLRRYLLNNDVVAMSGSSSQGSGADAAGHAWVACGYMEQNTKMYYMNWGWASVGDGFYNLADNNMYISEQGYNFNLGQSCLFGMIPPEDSNIRHNPVAIREVDNNTILGSAYPNPATMSVSLPYSTNEVADMQVFSIDGKLISSQRVQPGNGEISLRVDALPKGVYIYRMNSKSGKFIVQ